jgi:predicted alpha/beta-hydrolase family hydrolase
MMGIPLSNVYNRAAGDHFPPALKDPAKYAKWVLVNVEGSDAPLDSGFTDQVYQAISANPTFNARYAVVFSSPTHRIYERTVN